MRNQLIFNLGRLTAMYFLHDGESIYVASEALCFNRKWLKRVEKKSITGPDIARVLTPALGTNVLVRRTLTKALQV